MSNLCILISDEFDKNANSCHYECVYTYMRELVWRLSEFAFFVRLTSVVALFVFGGLILEF